MTIKALALSLAVVATAGMAHAGGSSTPNTAPGHVKHHHTDNNGKGKKLGHVKHHKAASTSTRRFLSGYRR